ncbi:hypothetical protein ALC62_09386, partial [Cyphomyrmex costatus]
TIEIDHFSTLFSDLGAPLKSRCNIAKSCVSKKQRALIPVMSVWPRIHRTTKKKRYLPPGDTNKSARACERNSRRPITPVTTRKLSRFLSHPPAFDSRNRCRRRIYPSNADPTARNPFQRDELVVLSLIRRCISLLRATGLLQASSLESPQPFSFVHLILLATLLSADLYDSTKLSILSGATFTTPLPSPLSFFPLFADRYIACRPAHRSSTSSSFSTFSSTTAFSSYGAPTRSFTPRLSRSLDSFRLNLSASLTRPHPCGTSRKLYVPTLATLNAGLARDNPRPPPPPSTAAPPSRPRLLRQKYSPSAENGGTATPAYIPEPLRNSDLAETTSLGKFRWDKGSLISKRLWRGS